MGSTEISLSAAEGGGDGRGSATCSLICRAQVTFLKTLQFIKTTEFAFISIFFLDKEKNEKAAELKI